MTLEETVALWAVMTAILVIVIPTVRALVDIVRAFREKP